MGDLNVNWDNKKERKNIKTITDSFQNKEYLKNQD